VIFVHDIKLFPIDSRELDKVNLNELTPIDESELRKKHHQKAKIKKAMIYCNTLLECMKNFYDEIQGEVDYNKEKVQLWKDYTIEEVSKYLVENYNNYGFVISFIIIKIGFHDLYIYGLNLLWWFEEIDLCEWFKK